MPTLTISKSYADGATLTAADLDNIVNGVQTFVNTTKLDASNIQAASITGTLIGSATVGTSNLASNAVTTSILASDASIDANRAVQTNHIQDAQITTAKLAATSVTRAKLAAVGQQISSSSSSYSSTATSATDVTNLSVTITTTGRPVFVGLNGNGSSYIGMAKTTSGSIYGQSWFQILRGVTTLSQQSVSGYMNANTNLMVIPASGIWFLDAVAAGTYTYKLQAYVTDGTNTSAQVINTTLVAFEL